MENIIRVLVAKPGLDGHDRGARILVQGLKERGMEVIYTGLHQTKEMIVQSVVQEDVDILCISILSGAHNTIIPEIIDALRKNNCLLPVIVGGIIPKKDIPLLLQKGVTHVFSQEESHHTLDDIAKKITELCSDNRKPL